MGNTFGEWIPITVHLTGEISARERTTPYKGTMFAAYPGDLVLSKIDARNGAIGILPAEIEKAVVTTEFPVFVPHPERIEGQFLRFVLRTGGFIESLRLKASGTSGRKRITPEAFLDLRIPLPTLAEQRVMVAAYREALDQADALDRQADEIEREARNDFETALGFTPPEALPDRRVFVAQYRHIDRWSPEGILRSTLEVDTPKPKHPVVDLVSLGRVSYGLQKSPANRPRLQPRPYLRVANVQRWRLDLEEVKTINVPDADMPKYRLESGDILLCEGNSPDLVGRGAIWRDEIPDCVHQNHVLRVRVDQSRVVPEFVLAVINSNYGQWYFRSKAKRTTNLASINSKEVSGFPLPLPSLDVQHALIGELFDAQRNAKRLRQEAAQVRAEGWADLERAVYATDDEVGSAFPTLAEANGN